MSKHNVVALAFSAWLLALASTVGAQSNPLCNMTLQGRIAWDYAGSVTWMDENMERLCRGGRAAEPALCFQRVMHGNVDRGDGTPWQWEHAIRLCAGSQSAEATVGCFERQRASGMTWQLATAMCAPGALRAAMVPRVVVPVTPVEPVAPPPVVPPVLAPVLAPRPVGGIVSVSSCQVATTGFLGMGSGRVAIVGVMNRTVAPRAFTVRIYATYPGNGRELVAESAVPTSPGVNATARVPFRSRPGMLGILCEVDQ